MGVMRELASFLANEWTIWGVAGLLLFWAVVSALFLRRGARRVMRALAFGRSRIAAPADVAAFRSQYDGIFEELQKQPKLAARWKEYYGAHVTTGSRIRSTMRPAEWFDLGSLLRTYGFDSRYHAALPNLLVGAGLLFTFLGLAAALSSAGDIVAEGADQASRNNALRRLLDAASFKFITSLVGLFLSIAYALWRKWQLAVVERSLDEFLGLLEARVPLVTPAGLQQEANEILERQRTALESFSTELAINIGSAFDKAFDQRLGEHIGPLTEAMQRLSGGMASRNEDAMQRMLEAFLERLQSGAGDRMQEVATSLAGLGMRLEGLQSGLGDAAIRMSQSADAMATRMGEGAESALRRITDQMGGVAESLRSVADQTRAAGADAGQMLSERIEKAAAGFEAAARSVAETLSAAASGMERRMADEAATSSGRLTAQLESMVSELRALAETSRTTGAASFEALAERVAAAAAGFESTAQRIGETMTQAAASSGGAFGKGAEDAVRRIADATEGMRMELQTMMVELKGSFVVAGDSVRDGAREGSAALRGSIETAGTTLTIALAGAAETLRGAGDAAGASLREGGEVASALLDKGAGALGGRAEGMAARVRELGDAADRIAARITDLDRVVRDTSAPLASAATDLKATGESASAAVQPLRTVGDNLRAATEQISGAVDRLNGAHQAAIRLTEGLVTAAARFENLDRAMAGTVDALSQGLQGFTRQVQEFVVATDKDLAKATNQLGNLTKALEETLDDFLEQIRRK